MHRLGDVPAKKALLLLGALIVTGGFVLALFSSFAFGTFGSFSGTAAAQNGFVGPYNSANNLQPSYGRGEHGGPGSTFVIASTTMIATSTSSAGKQGQVNPGGLVNSSTSTAGAGSLLEFSSDLTIRSGAPQITAAGVVALAYSVGGYVAYQATYTQAALVVIRVPASQYQQTLAKVEGLGTVVSLVSNSNDVRVMYTDLNATLASLRTEQGALLRLLNQSTTVNSTLAIENQLQGVDKQINEVESEILQTKTLIEYSTIDVTITESAQSAPLSMVLKAAPLNGTAPFSVTFDAIVKGGAQPYIVNYNFGDGSADQGQILIHTYYQSGDFKVTATATDQNGTAVISTKRIHVDAPPGQLGINNFFGTVANIFVSVVEGIVEVAAVVLPLAAVGAVVAIPLRRRGKPHRDFKQSQ